VVQRLPKKVIKNELRKLHMLMKISMFWVLIDKMHFRVNHTRVPSVSEIWLWTNNMPISSFIY